MINEYKSSPYHYYKKICNIIEDREEFNKIAAFCVSLGYKYSVSEHQAIKKSSLIMRNGWFVRHEESKNSFEIGCVYNGQIYEFVNMISKRKKEQNEPTGAQALQRFRKYCGKIAEKYATQDNEYITAVKEKLFEKAYIKLNNTPIIHWEDRVLYNVHHIDRHSAWPASLCEAHPEFYDYFHELFIGREEHPEYKCYLNYCIGAMQSVKIIGDRFPILARDAVVGNNRWMDMMTERLKKAGFSVIGYNTDGIFYIDFRNPKRLYHDELEGDDMGQWCHDHHYEQIRFKSAGAYEYIENGVYHAVVRGIPEEISKDFVWGDIYKHHPKKYHWSADYTAVLEEDMTDEELQYLILWGTLNEENEN